MKLRKIFSNFLFVNAFFVVYTSDVATTSPLDATKLNISPLFAFLMINLLMAIVPPFTAFIIKINQARDKLSSLRADSESSARLLLHFELSDFRS